ncbi:DCL family protein [Streptomyces peucetius]|uniref:DCL family protein n=1 Tax=Streptomyces peucetius TaxID=1950 RepID=A0ABY6ILK4_STRPE|nr:DCL family protein [Streptomyces peucetius]
MVDQEEDDLLLRDLLDMHPKAAEKVGPGVAHFRVSRTPRGNHKGPEAVHVNEDPTADRLLLLPPTSRVPEPHAVGARGPRT